MTEDMFGGPHRNDEVTRTEQLGCWSAKTRTVFGEVLAARGATALSEWVSTATQENQTNPLLTRPASLDM